MILVMFSTFVPAAHVLYEFEHWGLKMDYILHMIFSNEILYFGSILLKDRIDNKSYWFGYCLGTEDVTNHHRNQLRSI